MQNAQASPMFVLPVPKDNGYFMLLCQNQQKSFVCTYLEDFKKNPLGANPYLVLTLFDELVRVKQLALLRGDVIFQMTQDEGAVVMNQLLDSYLIDSEYEKVRQFNHDPHRFDFVKHTEEALRMFQSKLDQRKSERKLQAQKTLGPQKHSKPGSAMIPGQTEHFIIDEIKK